MGEARTPPPSPNQVSRPGAATASEAAALPLQHCHGAGPHHTTVTCQWKPNPVHKSPLFCQIVICLSFARHTTNTSFKLSSICHILVMSSSCQNHPSQTKKLERYTWYIPISIKPQKDILGIIYQLITKCIFSGSKLHVPGICLAYPCHNLFQFRGMLQQMKLSR